MTEENKSEQAPEHSHDSMYLVWHHQSGIGPDYESCHHCSFIRVPEIESLKSQNQRMREALKDARDVLSMAYVKDTSIIFEKVDKALKEVKE